VRENGESNERRRPASVNDIDITAAEWLPVALALAVSQLTDSGNLDDVIKLGSSHGVLLPVSTAIRPHSSTNW
jgi:hypothetical protein